MTTNRKRVVGLDLARSLAIAMVVAGHYSFFVKSRINLFPFDDLLGYLGVELFFALSGFLIGQIIIRTVLDQTSQKAIVIFWVRRWLRTLPAYYLVLILLIVHAYRAGQPLYPRWLECVFFLQNFDQKNAGGIFGVSWSLVIEEWFYFFIPLLAFGFGRWLRLPPARLMILLCAVGVIVSVGGRAVEAVSDTIPWWIMRKGVFTRMDALFFGVFFASLKAFWPQTFAALARHRRLLYLIAFAGWGAAAMVFYPDEGALEQFLAKTLLFSLVSCCSALLVVALDTDRLVDDRRFSNVLTPIITFVSTTSYAVYLIHWEFLDFTLNHFPPSEQQIPILATEILGCLAATYLAASLLYSSYEKPIMDARDRIRWLRDAFPGSSVAGVESAAHGGIGKARLG